MTTKYQMVKATGEIGIFASTNQSPNPLQTQPVRDIEVSLRFPSGDTRRYKATELRRLSPNHPRVLASLLATT